MWARTGEEKVTAVFRGADLENAETTIILPPPPFFFLGVGFFCVLPTEFPPSTGLAFHFPWL